MIESEKSLIELWSKAFQKIPKNRFNTYAGASGLILGLIPLWFGPIAGFAKEWSDLAALLVQVFASLLGFIIAGYTIFVTSANPNFVVAFWRHINDHSGFPLLKLHLVVYMRLFFSMFTATLFFGSIVVSYKIWGFVRAEVTLSPRMINFIQIMITSLSGWMITLSAVQIKAMIFNLYDLTITQAQFLEMSDAKDENDLQDH